jgi:hypothetical protein
MNFNLWPTSFTANAFCARAARQPKNAFSMARDFLIMRVPSQWRD